MPRTSNPDVVVVGAGIVGAACAYYLAGEGLATTVVEASFAGGGTTAAGMGHITVMDESEAQFSLTRYSRQLWADLAEDHGAAWEHDGTGTLWVATDEEEMALVAAKEGFYRERGVEASAVTAADVARLEPRLRSGLVGGLLVPDDQVLYPPGAARWLVDQAVARGAELIEGCAVRSFDPAAGALSTDKGSITANCIVNAAGAQAGQLIPELPIEPRKGHLVITDRYPGFCHHQIVELGYLKSAHTMTAASVAFNIQPRRTGQLLIGSSRELVGWDRSINREIVRKMLSRAEEYLPGIGELYCLRTWVGFRPAIADHLPLIGRWPLLDGMWIAAAHEGLGITMALGTGRLIADQIVGRSSAIDATPYDPARVVG